MSNANLRYEACIGLGSNIGDREQYLLQAIQMLHEDPSINVIRCSSIYETEPVGYVDQASFLNMAVTVTTELSPQSLLHRMHEIEQSLGRTRDIHWGPRTIDLDLLLYGQLSMATPELTLPHPRMLERPFVLIPLIEMRGELSIPGCVSGFSELEKLDGKEGVKRWKTMHWPNE
jgi:2-amino-4-hydroxy-6-hydroxymethyldihydropteridine diphosphokinase